ncbi:MAG: OmpH family outer membrane protein [Acidiferrobacterales bacterium]
MKKNIVLYTLFGSFMLGVWLATNPATAAEIKIGYVNAIKVIEQAPQAESALKKLQSEFEPRDKKLVDMQNTIKQTEDDLKKNALVMPESDRSATERELLVLKRDLKRATQEFREDYNMRRNEELATLQRLVKKVIIDIAKQENYDLIVHEGTIYASSTIDITDKVLKKLSQESANQ